MWEQYTSGKMRLVRIGGKPSVVENDSVPAEHFTQKLSGEPQIAEVVGLYPESYWSSWIVHTAVMLQQ